MMTMDDEMLDETFFWKLFGLQNQIITLFQVTNNPFEFIPLYNNLRPFEMDYN